jgi:transcriptional regulator with XRE-family HTH domain
MRTNTNKLSVPERLTNSKFSPNVSANIRAYAGIRNLSCAELARRIGVTQANLAKKWNGDLTWSLLDIEDVAEVLGVDPWVLCAPNPLFGQGQDYVARGGLEPPTSRL